MFRLLNNVTSGSMFNLLGNRVVISNSPFNKIKSPYVNVNNKLYVVENIEVTHSYGVVENYPIEKLIRGDLNIPFDSRVTKISYIVKQSYPISIAIGTKPDEVSSIIDLFNNKNKPKLTTSVTKDDNNPDYKHNIVTTSIIKPSVNLSTLKQLTELYGFTEQEISDFLVLSGIAKKDNTNDDKLISNLNEYLANPKYALSSELKLVSHILKLLC